MARSRSVADQLVGELVAAGARHIYGIVGDSLNPVVDAVRRPAWRSSQTLGQADSTTVPGRASTTSTRRACQPSPWPPSF